MKTNNQNIQQFRRYGQSPYLARLYHQIEYRFRKNQHTEALLKQRGLEGYIRKLNKWRFGTACVLSFVFIVLPFVTILAVPTMIWGLK